MKEVVMNRISLAGLMGLLFLGVCGCSQSMMGAVAKERVEKRISVGKGGSFKLDNVNGPITVKGGPEGEVHIVADKESHAVSESRAKEGLERVSVNITNLGNDVKVETKYPSNGGGFLSGYSVGVSYAIEVPPGTRLKLENVNGAIDLNTPGSDAEVETTNGAVTVTAAGVLSATSVNGKIGFAADSVEKVSTTNGSIEGKFTSTKPARAHIETVNGSVTLRLPEKAEFTIDAENLNGSVSSSFPGLASSKHSLHGDVNGGGAKLSVSTTNGSVTVEAVH